MNPFAKSQRLAIALAVSAAVLAATTVIALDCQHIATQISDACGDSSACASYTDTEPPNQQCADGGDYGCLDAGTDSAWQTTYASGTCGSGQCSGGLLVSRTLGTYTVKKVGSKCHE